MDLSNNLIMGYTEDELYNIIKNQPDFDCLPLPARWFKKYNIPPVETIDFGTFAKSRYTTRCAIAPKDLPAIVTKEPIRDLSGNIKLYKMLPPEDIPIEVISKPYEIKDEEVEAVEQFIKDQ